MSEALTVVTGKEAKVEWEPTHVVDGPILDALEKVCTDAMCGYEATREAFQACESLTVVVFGVEVQIALSAIARKRTDNAAVWLVGRVWCGPEFSPWAEAVADYEITSVKLKEESSPGVFKNGVQKLWMSPFSAALMKVARSPVVVAQGEAWLLKKELSRGVSAENKPNRL